MSKDREKEGLGLADRDFSLAWHGFTLGVVAVLLIACYLVGSKLVLGTF